VLELLVNVDVTDLQAATEFYTRAFGLHVGRRFDGAVELLGATSRLYLLAKAEGSAPFAGAAAPRDYRRHWTPVHLDFAVDDLEEAVRRAEAAGARCETDITSHPWGRIAMFSDPFGHGFCLLQFTGAGYDAIAIG
jgi:predicted enzyme related to lactoylglutathione lyase